MFKFFKNIFNKILKFFQLNKVFIDNNNDIIYTENMYTPKTTLNNPYYFVRNDIVYNINFNQDKDGCGEHMVTYETVEKELNPGDHYYDEKGDYQTVTSAGYYSVKDGNKLNNIECANVFPHFIVNYTDENNETLQVYYYLQDMIQDGDKFEGGKFVQDERHGNGYIDVFMSEVRDEIAKMVNSGKTMEEIKKALPHYYFEPSGNPDEDKYSIVVDGCKKVNVTYNGIQSEEDGFSPISEDQITDIVLAVANQHTIICANDVLEGYGMKISTDTLVDENNITSDSNGLILTLNVDRGDGEYTFIVPGYDLSKISYMEIDGNVVEPSSYNYNFTSGKHIVKIITDDTVMNNDLISATGFVTDINVGKNYTSIANETFSDNRWGQLKTVNLSDSITSIGNTSFANESITSLIIPNSVTSIGNNAFRGISTTNVVIPNSVVNMGMYTFGDAQNLQNATIGSGLTTLSQGVFYQCPNLQKVTIKGNNLQEIGSECFSNCSNLNNFTIPNSVTSIGFAAFQGSGLTSITIPSNVTSIGTAAFSDCSGLTTVRVESTTPPLDFAGGAFDNNAEGRKIYVPAESVDAYRRAEGWSQYAEDILPIE